MAQYRWIRRFIRRKMMPIPEDVAYTWKSRLSLGYMLLGWNAIGIVAYAAYTGKLDWADYYGLKTEEEKNMPSAEYYARAIGRPGGTTKLITMKGITQVDTKEFDYDGEVQQKQMSRPEEELTPTQRVQRRQQELKQMEELLAAEQSKQNPQLN